MMTYKALREMHGLGLGLDETDLRDVLAALRHHDYAGRLQSERTGEWMHVFKPTIAGTSVYLKVILRSGCVVISFHEEGNSDEENQ